MGVNDLWSILSPVREFVPLYSLTGKILAVDLSLWICEAQHAMMGKVTKPHLRNLFFRASSLQRMGIKLIFVMEGDAPKLKEETMRKRTVLAYRGKSAPKTTAARNTGRGWFKAVLIECAEMLDYLGIPWVTAAGEAEEMCAFLDARGLVDGCITSDGDAFLYGAQTVYRNFKMNTKDPQIECFKMSRVETELQLKRESLVGLAILLGCDYLPKGVPGVGKEQALKLIQSLNGQLLLHKFSEWNKTSLETLEFSVQKLGHCLVCRHPGSTKSHERRGCLYCNSKKFCEPQDYNSNCPCDWHRNEHAREASSIETNIKKKVLACDMFPFTEIINEFLIPKDKAVDNFRRRKPNLLLMQNFALEKMEWPKHYTSEKVLVLMTYTELMNRTQGKQTPPHIQPIRICKRRIRNGISCFEVMWKKPDHYVFPEKCPPEESDVVRTVEEENLLSLAFPDVVQQFHKETMEFKNNKLKKKKLKAQKENPVDLPDGVSSLFAQMSLKSSAHAELPVHLATETVLKSEDGQCFTTSYAPKIQKQSSAIQDGINSPSFKLIHQPQISASACSTATVYQACHSPSISAQIEELHLSSIDWQALSFSDPLSPEKQHSEFPKTVNKINLETQMKDLGTSVKCASHCREFAFPQDDDLSSFVCREEISLGNLIQCTPKEVSKPSNDSIGFEPKELGHIFFKPLVECLGEVSSDVECKKSGTTTFNPVVSESKKKTTIIAQHPSIVPPNFIFVESKHTARPSHRAKLSNKRNMCKLHVSESQGSSSEDENSPQIKQNKSKLKANIKPQPQKTVLSQYKYMLSIAEQPVCKYTPVADVTNLEKSQTSISRTNSETQSCMAKADDGNESDASFDSPRPLAERLKLKLTVKRT